MNREEIPTKAADQLRTVLNKAEASSGLSFPMETRTRMTAKLGPVFEGLEGLFPEWSAGVYKAAECIGRISRQLADFQGTHEISFNQLDAARAAVKPFCESGRPDVPHTLWKWCGEDGGIEE